MNIKNSIIASVTLTVFTSTLYAGVGFTTGNAKHHKPERGTTFENVSSLLAPYTRGGLDGHTGIAWLDYDGDKDLDIFITGGIGSINGLFSNNGDGSFTDVTVAAGLAVGGHGGVVAGDIDNDGYPDLFLSKEGELLGRAESPARMFHNNGDGTFTDITATAGVPTAQSNFMAAMGDINKDGYLDLFVTSPGHQGVFLPPSEQHKDTLYLNNGDLTFTDITVQAGVEGGLGSCVVGFSDYDNDKWLDIFVGTCASNSLSASPFHLYRNNHDNTFTDVADASGLNDDYGFWMSMTMGDIDNDGDIDIFSTNWGGLDFGLVPRAEFEPHALFRNNGDGTYTDVASKELGMNHFSFGASFGDWDNDGWLDLFYTGSSAVLSFIGSEYGNPGYMFFNDRHGNFVENNKAHGLDLRGLYTTGVARADYDNDGFLDIAIASSTYESFNIVTGEFVAEGEGTPVLIRNKGNSNHSVTIRPKGVTSNSMAIGARLTLYTRSNRQVREIYAGSSFASSESPWPTFGMGKNHFGLLKVAWPSGIVEWFFVRANRTVDIVEGKGWYGKRHR